MSRAVMQQALEALEVATSCLDGYYIPQSKTTLPEIEVAITALRAALAEPAEPEQEPVSGVVLRDGLPTLLMNKHIKATDKRLYTAPTPRKPLTEMAIRLTRDTKGMCVVALCYDRKEVPVIKDNGDVISHYVEPLGIAEAIDRACGITGETE